MGVTSFLGLPVLLDYDFIFYERFILHNKRWNNLMDDDVLGPVMCDGIGPARLLITSRILLKTLSELTDSQTNVNHSLSYETQTKTNKLTF